MARDIAMTLLAARASAIVREMLLRPTPLAVAIACLFALVRADVGPFVAFGAPLIAGLVASTAQDGLAQASIRSVRLGALAGCGAASIWLATQLALGAAHLLAHS